MARRLRMYEASNVYFVTARTFQGRFLIQQVAHSRDVSGGVLARAARLCDVELHAFIVTSNHLHLMVTARDGRLSSFMRYALGNLSKKLGPLVGWRGQFWERRFAAEPVLGAEAQEGRLRYILSHGVKEGLVRSPREWPGLSCLDQLLGEAAVRFPFFHWARRWKDGRLVEGGGDRFDRRWIETETLELSPLPAWRDLSPAQRRRRVEDMVAEIERCGREKHPEVKGVAAILQEEPQHRPTRLKRSPEPLCHAESRAVWLAYKRAYLDFARWFREASARFLAGDLLAEFPPRAFKPFCTAPGGAG